jgi:methyl-accepting chemotaxis protein
MDMKARLEAAIEAHFLWFLRFSIGIEDGIGPSLDPAEVAADERCEFGRWLYNEFPAALRGAPLYWQIRNLHAEFHRQAARIAAIVEQGVVLTEMGRGSEFNALSLKLIGRLQELKEQLELWESLYPGAISPEAA